MKKKTIFGISLLIFVSSIISTQSFATEVTEDSHINIIFYADAEKKTVLSQDKLPIDEYIYYDLVPDAGYYCKKLSTNMKYIDCEKILVGNTEAPEIKIESVLAGDADGNGEVDVKDLTRMMKYIARDPNIYYENRIFLAEADHDRSGSINVTDLTRVIKTIAGEMPELSKDFVASVLPESQTESYFLLGNTSDTEKTLTLINSTAELIEYINEVEQNFDTGTPFEINKNINNPENLEIYLSEYESKRFERVNLISKYNDTFFEENSIAVLANLSGVTTIKDIELRGDKLVIVVTDDYSNEDILIEGNLYEQNFIVLPKLNISEENAEILYASQFS